MNDLKRNKHFPKNIAANLKFINNLQPEWKRHVTIVRQTNNLHEADLTQIYDFLKMNQDEVNELRAERLAKTHDPLALMAHSQNSYNFPATHNDQSSASTHSKQSFLINKKYNPQPSLNQNFMQPPMPFLEDINDPTEANNAALILFAKAFQLTATTNNNQRTASNPRNRHIAQPGMNMSQDRQSQYVGGNGGNEFGQYARQVAHNQQWYNAWQNGIANQNGTGNIVAARAEGTGNRNQGRCYNCRGLGHIVRNCTTRPRRRDDAYLQTQLLIAQKEEAEIQLQAEEFDFMAAAGDLDEIEEVNANCILMATLQHASTSGTQLDKAPVYDTDGSAEVQLNDNCYDNEIFIMFTQEEQYMNLLEPIPEPQLVPQNDNHVTSVALSMVQSGGTVETSSAPNDETHLSDDTTPSVAQKFLNEVKSSLVTLQRVVKQKLLWKYTIGHLLLINSVSHDIMSIVQNGFVDVPSDLQTELDRTKEKLELCIMKKEKEYAVLWNNGTICFGNDHIAAILGYGDLNWGNITITRVYFVEGLGHNLFLVDQFRDADLEVAFGRNTCFIRDLDGVDLLKGNYSTNLYSINLYDMASASPICLMARATPTKSWLWHQQLSHLNFDTINDLAKNNLVSGLPKCKYAKEHLCPSCEQGKSKRASHPPKPVSNSKQRLHLLHMDLCYPMRVASINGKRYVLVIVDDYSRYTWVHFLRTKDETPEEYFDSVGITYETSSAKTPPQNRVVERRNRMLVEAAKTMLIFSHAPLFLWTEAIATATKKIMETMNVTFDELSAMAFEQNSSRPGLQSLTFGQISSKLELTYAPSTITPQRPSKRDLDILFEPLVNEYLGGRPSEAPRTIPAAPVLQNLQAPTTAMSIQDFVPTLTNSSNTPVSSHNVNEQSQQHAQQQRNLTSSPTASAADNVSNAVFEGDLFVNPFATPSTESVVSFTHYVDPLNMHTFYQLYPHDYQWTKDHPLEQVIGEPSRPVLTRNQLKTDGNMCIYALTVSIMEPKSVKESLTDPAWIKSMQEELHQFIRLDVWELEDMYVCQPEGFIDADHPSHVYKLKKALYGLKQVPRAWYDELSTFLLQNGFSKGTIDPTLFIRRFDDDILVVQVYADDIIFGSTNPKYATLFSDLMKSRFEMSTIEEMTFFLGLQVNQSPNGIFINQSNYVNEILKKYELNTCDIIGTPMDIKDKLDLDQIGTLIDAMKYHGIIGSLMYIMSSRSDIVHATCDSGFKLTGFSDANYASCKDAFKSTFGGAHFLDEKFVSWSSKKQDCTSLSTAKSEYVSLSVCCAQVPWMRTQLTDYGYHFDKILIYVTQNQP
nr:uncharacterized mitochondrial protein AtMg00810-like [Tanacetum cinerariifolium]